MMKEIKVPVARRRAIEKVLKEISNTINLHNKTVQETKKELKHKFCFEWIAPIFILTGIALVLLIPHPFKEEVGWILIVTIFIAYLIIEKKYCKPYYQDKEDKVDGYRDSVTYYEMELSDLIKYKVVLHHKCFLWNDYVFIGNADIHQDDYYSELYGGRWTNYVIEIDGKYLSFNPYKDIVYT